MITTQQLDCLLEYQESGDNFEENMDWDDLEWNHDKVEPPLLCQESQQKTTLIMDKDELELGDWDSFTPHLSVKQRQEPTLITPQQYLENTTKVTLINSWLEGSQASILESKQSIQPILDPHEKLQSKLPKSNSSSSLPVHEGVLLKEIKETREWRVPSAGDLAVSQKLLGRYSDSIEEDASSVSSCLPSQAPSTCSSTAFHTPPSLIGMYSKRFLSSPTPSSSASMMASESEEEGFDDIEFPDHLDQDTLDHRQHPPTVQVKVDDEFMQDLEIPDDVDLNLSRRFQTAPESIKHVSNPTLIAQPTESLSSPCHAVKQETESTTRKKSEQRDASVFNRLYSMSSRLPTPRPSSVASTSRSTVQPLQKSPQKSPQKIPCSPSKSQPIWRPFYKSTSHSRSNDFLHSKSSPTCPSTQHFQKLSHQLISTKSSKTGGGKTVLSKPKKSESYGDGTELDSFEDLTVQVDKEKKYIKKSLITPPTSRPSPSMKSPSYRTSHVTAYKSSSKSSISNTNYSSMSRPSGGLRPSEPLTTSRPASTHASPLRTPPKDKARSTLNHATKKIRQKKVPTLIRNLNQESQVQVVGEMVYNPVLKTWEGNDVDLQDFDCKSSAPGSPLITTKPALITHMDGHVPDVIGNMRFDPLKMCWIGNEEDVDIFAECDSEPLGEVAQSSTAATVLFPSRANCVRDEFKLSSALKESLYISESQHKLFMGNWYPKAVSDARTLLRDTNKSHLYDIRRHLVS